MNQRQESILKKVIERNDPEFLETIDTASHVGLCIYNNDVWSEENVEGPLFIYRSKTAPFFRLMIMNRKKNNIFMIGLDECKFSFADNFIMVLYMQKVYGLWFFDTKDCKHISELFFNFKDLKKQLDI